MINNNPLIVDIEDLLKRAINNISELYTSLKPPLIPLEKQKALV